MAKYRECEKCGAALDHGEVCDCESKGQEEKDVLYEANRAAIREALAAEVLITLEKKAGSETFRRKIEASSASAALNGLAVLLREYAALAPSARLPAGPGSPRGSAPPAPAGKERAKEE